MTANILPLVMFVFCIQQELVIMILILVPDKCIYKQMRRQFSWLGALQNCTNHHFFKTNQNSNVQQNIWQIMLLLYLFLNIFIQYPSIFKLTEPLMHFMFRLGMCLFADCGVGIVPCVCAIAPSISPPSVWLYHISYLFFPFMFLEFLLISLLQDIQHSQSERHRSFWVVVKPGLLS